MILNLFFEYLHQKTHFPSDETPVADMPPFMLVLDQGVENYLGKGYFASREELLKVYSAVSYLKVILKSS